MANFHSDEWIKNKIREHYFDFRTSEYSEKTSYPVALLLAGSQNYGMDIESSDVDSKVIVIPSFHDVAMNKPAVSTTYIRKNDEHIDIKDVRVFFQILKKQNINFIETLYTDYHSIHSMYEPEWNMLIANRDRIARLNPYRSVQTMIGQGRGQCRNMFNPTPARAAMVEKYGYDPKCLCHLARINYFLKQYVAERPYEECLRPGDPDLGFIMSCKMGVFDVNAARSYMDKLAEENEKIGDAYFQKMENAEDPAAVEVLEQVQVAILRQAFEDEFRRCP